MAATPAPSVVIETVEPSRSKLIHWQQSRSTSTSCRRATALPSLTTRRIPPGTSSREMSAVRNSFCHAYRVSRSSSWVSVQTMVSELARYVGMTIEPCRGSRAFHQHWLTGHERVDDERDDRGPDHARRPLVHRPVFRRAERALRGGLRPRAEHLRRRRGIDAARRCPAHRPPEWTRDRLRSTEGSSRRARRAQANVGGAGGARTRARTGGPRE